MPLAVAAFALAPASAQPTPRAMSATATLPESNEAMILSSRVEDAVKAGDFRLAIRLIEQVTELPAELVVTPATRTYYPVWRQGVRLLRRLPPAGVHLYRQLYDAEVAARLEQAAAESNVEALRELFRRYPIATAWPRIGQELMGLLLDRAGYGEAVEVARELAASGATPSPEREAQLVVALGRILAWDEAERRLAALEEQAAAHARPDWPDRLRDVRRWLERTRGEGPAARESARRFEPLLESELAWDQPLAPIGDAGNFDDDDVLADAIAQTRRLPLQAPTIAAGALVVRMRGTLWCLDALTLTPRWRVPEIPAESTNLPAKWRPIGGIGFAAPTIPGDDRLRLSRDARRFIAEPLRHSVAIAFGLVLSVEALQPADAEPDDTPLTFGRGGDATVPNELVARELSSGRLVWRSGGDAGAPLFGAAIQDAPLAIGDVLVAAVAQGGELRLVALDPPTGQVLRTTTLVGPPTHFPVEGGRCQLIADETTVYVCTGNGVVAAVSQDEFRWKWAAVYPSTLGVHLGMVWWRPQMVAAAESPVDRPLLSADLLVLAPVDSSEIFALDRFTGQERWRVPRAEHAALLGLTATGLVLGGSRLSCVDLSDGRTLRWRSVPLELSGRPTLRGERIFAPTRGGLLVCDARTGRVVRDGCVGRPPGRWTTANLVIGSDALFAVAPGGVTRYPDPDATEAACDALRAADEQDIRAALAGAWLRLLAADYPAAIELLDEVTAPDEQFSETRDRLLSMTFVALARDTGEGRAKLDWLRRAASLSLAPEAAARLANLIGATLEEAGLFADALDHYRDVLLASPAALVTESDDPALRRAAWLHAAQRVRRCLEHLPAGRRAPYLDSLVATRPDADAARLDRARLIVASEPQMAELRRALTLAALRPELAVLTLPAADDVALPPATRRALHLARWETHVALGRLAEAAADRAVWNEIFAGAADAEAASQPATTGGDDDESRRVERIDRALRKLEQAVEAPFDEEFGKRWDMPAAELILDPRVNTPSLARTLLVRDLRDRQIALCSTRVGTQIRKTWDALEQNGRLDRFRERAAAEVFLGNSGELVDADRLAWPAAVYGDLAAVPVAGGLVCVGLGPERAGGQRLWELAIPEWDEVSDEFVERCVGGREGFYFASRPTRIALAGLHDGQVRWQRDLATISVARLYLASERLIVVGTGQELLSMSAVFGDDVRRVPAALGTLRAAHVVGDTLVAWTDDALHALDPTTLEPRWTLAIQGVRQWTEVAGRPWIAFRSRSRPGWNVVDVAAGKPVFGEPLATFSDAALFAVDGARLFVATSPGAGGDGEQRRNLQLAAYDSTTAAELWTTTIDTTVPLNAAQLLAHPDHLPLLLLRRPGNAEGWNDLSSLTIQRVEKSSGAAGRALPVGRHFDSLVRQLEQRRAWCGVTLVATPTRVFVQAAGNIVAYGTAPPASAP
ncbi:MAG: PQQ-binding-like beta-propeller repeat protein [Phycisphaerae bacterium]